MFNDVHCSPTTVGGCKIFSSSSLLLLLLLLLLTLLPVSSPSSSPWQIVWAWANVPLVHIMYIYGHDQKPPYQGTGNNYLGAGSFPPWPQTSIFLKIFLRMVTNTVVFTMNLAPNVANTVVFTMSPAFVLFDWLKVSYLQWIQHPSLWISLRAGRELSAVLPGSLFVMVPWAIGVSKEIVNGPDLAQAGRELSAGRPGAFRRGPTVSTSAAKWKSTHFLKLLQK